MQPYYMHGVHVLCKATPLKFVVQRRFSRHPTFQYGEHEELILSVLAAPPIKYKMRITISSVKNTHL